MSGRVRFELVLCVSLFATSASLACGGSRSFAAQEAPTPSSQSQGSTATPSAADPAAPQPAKKPKKLWTNEDLGGATGTVSQPGAQEVSSKAKVTPGKSTDLYVANLRQQLRRLRAQVADINKQIADLDNFSKGNTNGNGALQLHKRYSSEPINAQIRKLQDKKKQLEAKQEAVLDDARKKGIAENQLP
jgi:hypothetical protein